MSNLSVLSNCWSVWWLNGCNIIYVLLVCFLRYSPVSGHFNPPPYCTCYQTSWQLSTVEILQHWSCWTYLLRSTRSTTTFCIGGTALKWFQLYLTRGTFSCTGCQPAACASARRAGSPRQTIALNASPGSC